jgi:hypothetical protein
LAPGGIIAFIGGIFLLIPLMGPDTPDYMASITAQ